MLRGLFERQLLGFWELWERVEIRPSKDMVAFTITFGIPLRSSFEIPMGCCDFFMIYS
jgi:hypothetical protein